MEPTAPSTQPPTPGRGRNRLVTLTNNDNNTSSLRQPPLLPLAAAAAPCGLRTLAESNSLGLLPSARGAPPQRPSLPPLTQQPSQENLPPQSVTPPTTPPLPSKKKSRLRNLWTPDAANEEDEEATTPLAPNGLASASANATRSRHRSLARAAVCGDTFSNAAPAMSWEEPPSPAEAAKAEEEAAVAFKEWQDARRAAAEAREQVRILQPAATPGRRNARTPARQSPGSSMISRLRRANQAAMAVSVPVAFDVMSDAPETEALPDRMASLTPSSPAAAAPAQPPPPRSAKKKEYDVGVDPSPPSKPAPSLCARLCCLFCCNLWLLLLILSALGPAIALSNSFPANEMDYWYSARVCPRHPGGGIPTYEQYSDLPSLPSELSCSAPTNRTTCHGSPCALMGCTHMETEESCKSCCGGMLQRHRAQCAFPFRSADEGDHAALHHQCIPDPSSYSATAAGWCPTEVDDTSRLPINWPRASGGTCSSGCKQANFVGSAASTCGAASCPSDTEGTTSSSQRITISADGWGGSSGLQYGASYHLVAFTFSDYLQADIELTSASSSRTEPLVRSALAPHLCGSSTEKRRLLNQRRPGVFESIFGRASTSKLRVREGEASRWDGIPPVYASHDVFCAKEVVPTDTIVTLAAGGCDAGTSGVIHTSVPYDRSELGAAFTITADDLPLTLTVHSLNASMRARAGVTEPPPPPSVHFTLWTDQLDTTPRLVLIIISPILFCLLSCCCCLCLTLCCSNPATDSKHKVRPLATIRISRTSTVHGDSEAPTTPRPNRDRPGLAQQILSQTREVANVAVTPIAKRLSRLEI